MEAGLLKMATRIYRTVPFIETRKYINPEYIPSGMAFKLRQAGLSRLSQIHKHIANNTLVNLPGIGDHWAEQIKQAFTYVDRRKVSQETVDLQKGMVQKRVGRSIPEATTPLPPVFMVGKGSLCVREGHKGETTYSTASLKRVGRKCQRCPAKWEEDWSDR